MWNLVDVHALLLLEVLSHDLHLVSHLNHEGLSLDFHNRFYGLLAHESTPSLELSHSLGGSGLLILEDFFSQLLTDVGLNL